MHEQVFAVISVTEINTVWSSFTSRNYNLQAKSREDIAPGSLVKLHGCHSSGRWCNATATEYRRNESGKSTCKTLNF